MFRKAASATTPSQPPSNHPESAQKPGWSFAHLILSFVIGYIARDCPTVINGYMKAYGYGGDQDSAEIGSNPMVVDSPETFMRDYEKMESALKANIYRDRDPGAYFKSPTAGTASNSEEFDFLESFTRDYERMERELKIYIYRDRDPGGYFKSPRELTGMYGSEAYFFKNVKESHLRTTNPLEARLFFIPISWHQMRIQKTPNENMTVIVENYVERLISKHPYWNKTEGADHFLVICHENGVGVADGVPFLKKNPIRLVCPPTRTTPSLFEGIPNAEIRSILQLQWENDTELDIQNNLIDTDEGYVLYYDRIHRTKFCICPHGFPKDADLISDSILYGCVPVILSKYMNIPLYNTLDWHKFSILLEDVYLLKDTLRGIQAADFSRMQNNLHRVKKYFQWNSPPVRFDAFHMVMFDIWRRRL